MEGDLIELDDLVAKAKDRGFEPTHRPYHNDPQDGWVVEGMADFMTHYKNGKKTGSGWTYTGWVFDTEELAQEFYNKVKTA